MSENALKIKVTKFLKAQGYWFTKIADKYQIGLPDFFVCRKGLFIAIELKDKGEVPRPMQYKRLRDVRVKGEGIAFWADNYEDFLNQWEELVCKKSKNVKK